MSYRIGKSLFQAVINERYDEAHMLLTIGANPNQLLDEGISPFHVAVGVRKATAFTRLLIDHGADVNVKSIDDWTPLHVCACWNKTETLKLLLEYGANPSIVNNDFQTPLQLAEQFNNKECADILREYNSYLRNYQNEANGDDLINDLDQSSFNSLLANKNLTAELSDESTLVRSSTTNLIENDSTALTIKKSNASSSANTYTNSNVPTVIERKIKKTPTKHQNGEINGVNNTNNKSSSSASINIGELEKVISSMIDMKLQEKRLITSPSASIKDTNASIVSSNLPSGSTITNNKIQNNKENASPATLSTTASTNGIQNSSLNAKAGRFHSPEASARIPATHRDSSFNTTRIINNSKSPVNNKMPVIKSNSVNGDKNASNRQNNNLPSEHTNSTTSNSNSNIYLKLKSWLNKMGNSNEHRLDLTHSNAVLCHKATPFSNLCLGSGMHHVNSDFYFDKKFNQQQNQVDKTISEIKPQVSNILNNTPIGQKTQSKLISPKHVSLFSEIGKELASIEKNSIRNDKSLACNGSEKVKKNEVIYQLDDDDIYFKETTLLTSDQSNASNSVYGDDNYYTANSSTVIYGWDAFSKEKVEQLKDEIFNKTVIVRSNDVSDEIKKLSNCELRKKIEAFGDRPGPITNTTRKIYELRLMQLQLNGPCVEKLNNEFNEKHIGFSNELINALNNKYEDQLKRLYTLELDMSNSFDKNTGNWREGHVKACFNYLLIDPRVSENLPARAKYLDSQEIFRAFIASVFYIGKGTRARPHAHLYDALKIWKNKADEKKPTKENSRKIKQILNIWEDNCGVVSLICFQNVIPVEPYTREAAMIDAIGLNHLTNLKKGDYYGVSNAWSNNKKCELGVILLKRACDVFIAEGERQIKPIDI